MRNTVSFGPFPLVKPTVIIYSLEVWFEFVGFFKVLNHFITRAYALTQILSIVQRSMLTIVQRCLNISLVRLKIMCLRVSYKKKI